MSEVFMGGGIGLGGNLPLLENFVVPYYLFKNPNAQDKLPAPGRDLKLDS